MDPIVSDEKNEEITTNDAVSSVSLGEQFKKARTKMGKGIIEVANHLNLAEHVVEDIENDNYSRVASDVYAKGYLRTYAKFVGLSESAVLDQYAGLGLGKTIVSTQPQLIAQKQPLLNHKHQRWVTYAMMAVFFVTFIYWWTSGAGDSDDSDLLVLEEKRTVKIEQPVKEAKKAEKPADVKEPKIAGKEEEKKEINIVAKAEEPQSENKVDVEEKKPLIISPEDVLSG